MNKGSLYYSSIHFRIICILLIVFVSTNFTVNPHPLKDEIQYGLPAILSSLKVTARSDSATSAASAALAADSINNP